jgi:hypothetical protein
MTAKKIERYSQVFYVLYAPLVFVAPRTALLTSHYQGSRLQYPRKPPF